MAVTFYWNEVRFVVPPSELAETMNQLAQVAGAAFGGAQSRTTPSLPPQPTHFLDGTPVPQVRRSIKDMAVAFLSLLDARKGSGGAPLLEVMRALGATHPKGVGSKAAQINKLLDRLGFAIPDVYTNERDVGGERFWMARGKLADALKAVRSNATAIDEVDAQLEFEESPKPVKGDDDEL